MPLLAELLSIPVPEGSARVSPNACAAQGIRPTACTRVRANYFHLAPALGSGESGAALTADEPATLAPVLPGNVSAALPWSIAGILHVMLRGPWTDRICET
jgi:hypothetical protein